MTDDKSKRGHPDSDLINLHEDYEVRGWCNRLGCTEQKLRQAVATVGNSAAKVREWLRTH